MVLVPQEQRQQSNDVLTRYDAVPGEIIVVSFREVDICFVQQKDAVPSVGKLEVCFETFLDVDRV
jgi:hypothetical protein